ncbi:MAG TPA: hypothetical protein VFV95_00070 [Vicinamibacterales bacterium]|nr:hypothetical protein [Vicinamibacterales bacterium]
MRRGQIALLMLLPFGVATAAQAQDTLLPTVRDSVFIATPPTPETVIAKASLEDVVSRMMSFDRDRDGKVQKAELSERMHNLMSRGDADHDGALDRSEILTLATAPAAAATIRGVQVPSGYSFGDQVGLSSRQHIEGSLEDLRLTGTKREEAQTVVKAFVDELEKSAASDLLKELEPLLAPQQLTAVRTALDSRARVIMLRSKDGETRQISLGADLTPRIAAFRLPAAQDEQARAAVDRYKARLRLAGPERGELMAKLNGILSAEEQTDFSAALDRRPVVANNGLQAGFVGPSGVFQNIVIDAQVPATFVPFR